MIYQYKCSACNTEIEIERGIRDPEVAPICIDCHGTMNRVWSSPAITFNGAGFYVNDK